jgi:hypothetical protein
VRLLHSLARPLIPFSHHPNPAGGLRLRGLFGSFNTTAEDSPDRDLILQKPIFYRPAGENAREVLYAYTPYDHEASVAPPCDSFR